MASIIFTLELINASMSCYQKVSWLYVSHDMLILILTLSSVTTRNVFAPKFKGIVRVLKTKKANKPIKIVKCSFIFLPNTGLDIFAFYVKALIMHYMTNL